MKYDLHQIGKGGLFTSFVIDKSIFKSLIKQNKSGGSGNTCQENIDKEIDNKHKWLQLDKILQNIPGKGITTLIGKINTQNIIIKAQIEVEAQKEYTIQEKLKGCHGFIKYTCIFTCGHDKEYIEKFSHVKDEKLCKLHGNTMGVIIMPYYSNGSLEDYLKQNKSSNKSSQIKEILIKIIENYVKAYTQHGFTHGDLFTKNIVLDDNIEPVIIDFEKSNFNDERKLSTFWRDLDDLLGDISRYMFRNELDNASRIIMIHRAYGKEPNGAPITDLISAIRGIVV